MHRLSTGVLPGRTVFDPRGPNLSGKLFVFAKRRTHRERTQEVTKAGLNVLSLQDRDECLEIPDLCADEEKCLNTPGNVKVIGSPVVSRCP